MGSRDAVGLKPGTIQAMPWSTQPILGVDTAGIGSRAENEDPGTYFIRGSKISLITVATKRKNQFTVGLEPEGTRGSADDDDCGPDDKP